MSIVVKEFSMRPRSPARRTSNNSSSPLPPGDKFYNCRQTGHFARKCRMRTRSRLCSTGLLERGDHDVNKYDVQKYSRRTRPYKIVLAISVNGQQVQAVVDTAEQIIIISQSFA